MMIVLIFFSYKKYITILFNYLLFVEFFVNLYSFYGQVYFQDFLLSSSFLRTLNS